MLKSRLIHTCTSTFKHVVPNNIKGKGSSSAKWLTRQLSDPYVEKAKMMNYRCRSAFKLIEIDDRHKFLNPGKVIVDCGAAPGSWTQVAVNRVNADGLLSDQPRGVVIAVDKQQLFPISGAIILGNSDFTNPVVQDTLKTMLDGKEVDAVISDMAPNTTGVKEMDDENIINLCYSVLRFAVLVSKVSAVLVVKLWQSGYTKKLQNDMERFYHTVKVVKPNSSRTDSAEIFLIAKDFKGLKVS
ncbi:hypothetical protein RN001_013936 [Aquatica leii]|uniref:rRNA methyltransferase 2, mitochondrial n=1 Tax=Aquatica leii TaxID=1421715 RepID=A0AAN7S7A2_9COLE|nr:hypothetical protein RN001_013936 [Aquatica leii]